MLALQRVPRPFRRLAPHLDLLRDLSARQALIYWRSRRAAVDDELAAFSDALYRRIWEEAADAVDAQVTELGAGFLGIRRGSSSTLVWRQEVMIDHPVSSRLARNKPLTRHLLRNAGLPVADAVDCSVRDLGIAEAFVESSVVPCVVKPASGNGGNGVTCAVATVTDLRRAAMRAAAFGDNMLVERQVTGNMYRLLLLDGHLLGAVRRGPPKVVGDGRTSIGELIGRENARRLRGPADGSTFVLRTDLDCLLTLRARGRTLRTVPASGEGVAVKAAVNQNSARDQEAVNSVAPELIDDAARAARVVKVRLAGVDVILPDATHSLDAAGGVVLEVNANPGLHYHYLVANPADSPRVAVPILTALLDGVAGDDAHSSDGSTG